MIAHERQGSGPDLLLVHGWGLHSGCWGDLPARLARHFRVTAPDLPGHGRNRDMHAVPSLDALADRVAEACPASAIWLGWSLGGLIALKAALRHPQQVARLVLVGATPKFVQAAGWAGAMPQEDLARFAAGLRADPRATLLRFLSLQVGTEEAERAVLRTLRRALFAHGDPSPPALAAGLEILAHTDLRPRLPDIHAPALVVHGSQDRLVPPAAGAALAAQLPDARYHCLDGAGHAPFLSRPQEFEAVLSGFLT